MKYTLLKPKVYNIEKAVKKMHETDYEVTSGFIIVIVLIIQELRVLSSDLNFI